MKLKRSLSILLALCMVVSMMVPIALCPAAAASATLDAGRITYYDNLREQVDVANSTSTLGDVTKLFDGTFDKMEGGWPGSVTVIIKMTEAAKVTAYTMATNDDGAWINRAPVSWTISGSNDGEAYTQIDTVENHPVLNVSNVYWEDDLRIDNPGEYLYYKMEITQYGNSGHFQIGELVLSGYDLTALEAVEAQIEALPSTITASDVENVRAARTAYDALGDVKASVQNTSKLLVAEAQADVFGTEDEAAAAAFTSAVNAIGTVTYKSRPAIEAAEEKWGGLSQNDQTTLNAYKTRLDQARTDYQALLDSYTWTAPEARPSFEDFSKVGLNAWVQSVSDDVWTATRTAMSDAVKYQYTIGRKVDGDSTGNYDAWMTDAGATGFWYTNLGDAPDNYNAQEYRSRFTTLVSIFPGMAFVTDSVFAQGWNFQTARVLGEWFKYDGKTYQVMWDRVCSYDTVADESYAAGDLPSVTNNLVYPNERLSSTESETNIFRYAYAKYSQDNRWNGLTLGIPQSEYAVSAGTKTRAQRFVGPQGNAYLLTTTDLIDAAPTDMTADTYGTQMAASYYVVTGAMANTIANTDNFFGKSGDLVSYTAEKITFANGELTADGYTPYAAESAANVTALIAALPAADALQAFHKTNVEAVRADYNALISEAKELVTNLSTLEAAEAAIETIYTTHPEAARNLVLAIHSTEDPTLIGTDKKTIEGYRATYDAMATDVKSYVTNVDELEALETKLTAVTTAYKATIDAWVAANSTWTKADGANTVPWMRSGLIDAEGMADTAEAIGDEVYYQWVNRDLYLGFTSGAAYDNWDGFCIGLDTTPNDNLGNPWGDARQVAFIEAAFPGMAFSNGYYLPSKIDRNEPTLSNTFTHNGRVYQQFWGFVASYDATVEIADKNTNVDYKTEALYPGKDAANANSFRYAYAKYNMEHKWDDVTLGLVGNTASSNNYTYQSVANGTATAVLLNTTARMNAITLNTDAAGYIDQLAENAAYVVTGSLATAFMNMTSADHANLGDLVSITETEITFQYGKLTADSLEIEDADYTAVNEALASIPADIDSDVYTTDSAQAVKDAQAQVVTGLKKIDQDKVDAFADAINKAVANLVNRVVEMGIDISTGMATGSSTMDNRYDITWNATLTVGDDTSIEDINSSGVLFKSYGVYYAMEGETLKDYQNASAEEIRQKVFDQGDNIDIYTSFGFRLKNVVAEKTRAAMFYLEYEFAGKTFIVLSTVDEVIATVAE